MSTPFLRCLLVLLVLCCAASARGQCASATGVTAQSRGCTIHITWQANMSPPTGWRLLRGEQANGADAVSVGNAAAGDRAIDDSPPRRDITYYYAVQALSFPFTCNNPPVSTFVSGQLLFADGVPITISTATCGQIALSWSPFPDATSFAIFRSEIVNPVYVAIGSVSATTTTYTDTTGVLGRQYYYAVLPALPCYTQSGAGANLTTVPGPPKIAAPVYAQTFAAGSPATLEFPMDRLGMTAVLAILRDGAPVFSSAHMRLVDNPPAFPRLVFDRVTPGDVAVYTLTLSTQCGFIDQSVALAVRTPCPADFNASGTKDVQDIFDFLNAWFAPCP